LLDSYDTGGYGTGSYVDCGEERRRIEIRVYIDFV
jgi:hypothetical protein